MLAFAATQGVNGIAGADLLVLAAVAFAALGYAEGGALSRTYGGWQVICWALVLTAPFSRPGDASPRSHGVHAGTDAWLGFAYVSVISMFLGFFAWYHGLALGGVAKIGQIQLAQPVLTLGWSALILGETVTAAMLVAALAVLACVARDAAHPRRAQPTMNAGGGVPSITTGTSRSGLRSQAPRTIPKITTSCTRSPCRCHALSTPSRRNPIRSSARCERPLRVFAHAVRRSKPSRSNASAADHRLGLEVRARAPPLVPEPGADGRAAVAARELAQAGHADRPVVARRRSGSRAGRPPRAARAASRCRLSGCSIVVYGPHEKKRVTAGSAASSNSRGASAAVA